MATSPEDRKDEATEDSRQDMQCDFCSRVVPSVRRVALDGDYERLRTKHSVRYACPSCSQSKEEERLGVPAG
jgi:ribosomal protein L37AE/L43A